MLHGNKQNQGTESYRGSLSPLLLFSCVFSTVHSLRLGSSPHPLGRRQITTAQRFSLFLISPTLRHLMIPIPGPNILQKSHMSQIWTGCLTTDSSNHSGVGRRQGKADLKVPWPITLINPTESSADHVDRLESWNIYRLYHH